jgi:hypothetical protein
MRRRKKRRVVGSLGFNRVKGKIKTKIKAHKYCKIYMVASFVHNVSASISYLICLFVFLSFFTNTSQPSAPLSHSHIPSSYPYATSCSVWLKVLTI